MNTPFGHRHCSQYKVYHNSVWIWLSLDETQYFSEIVISINSKLPHDLTINKEVRIIY